LGIYHRKGLNGSRPELVECPYPFIGILPAPCNVESDLFIYLIVPEGYRRAILRVVECRNVVRVGILQVEISPGNVSSYSIPTIGNVHKSKRCPLSGNTVARIRIQLIQMTVALQHVERGRGINRAVRREHWAFRFHNHLIQQKVVVTTVVVIDVNYEAVVKQPLISYVKYA